jgi:hypothetical protein
VVRCYLGCGFSFGGWERGGVRLPGSRLNFRQRTMRVHMNEPRMRPERQAADMAVVATIISLRGMSVQSVSTREMK